MILSWAGLTLHAQQIKGIVTDEETGDSIPYASVVYKGHKVAVVSGTSGRYSIVRHDGWTLTFSAVGYKSRTVHVNNKVAFKGMQHDRLRSGQHPPRS